MILLPWWIRMTVFSYYFAALVLLILYKEVYFAEWWLEKLCENTNYNLLATKQRVLGIQPALFENEMLRGNIWFEFGSIIYNHKKRKKSQDKNPNIPMSFLQMEKDHTEQEQAKNTMDTMNKISF